MSDANHFGTAKSVFVESGMTKWSMLNRERWRPRGWKTSEEASSRNRAWRCASRSSSHGHTGPIRSFRGSYGNFERSFLKKPLGTIVVLFSKEITAERCYEEHFHAVSTNTRTDVSLHSHAISNTSWRCFPIWFKQVYLVPLRNCCCCIVRRSIPYLHVLTIYAVETTIRV